MHLSFDGLTDTVNEVLSANIAKRLMIKALCIPFVLVCVGELIEDALRKFRCACLIFVTDDERDWEAVIDHSKVNRF